MLCHAPRVSGRSPVLIGALGALATLAMIPVAAIGSLLVWMDTCDRDDGYPYSAPGSSAGRFCDSAASTPYFVTVLVAPVIVALAFAVWAVWERRMAKVVIGLGLAIGLLLTMCGAVGFLPSG